MTFDSTSYLKYVKSLQADKSLKPVIADATRRLQDENDLDAVAHLDLAALFAVTNDVSDFSAHFKQVQAALGKKAAAGALGPSVESLRKTLLSVGGDAVLDASFWAGRQAQRAAAQARKIDEFGAAIALENQALRVVATDQLLERARASGLGGTPDASVIAAVEKAGVAVRPDFPLPPEYKIPPDIKKGSALGGGRFRSIVDTLAFGDGRPTRFTVIDEFTVDGTRVGLPTVEKSQGATEQGQSSDDDLEKAKKLYSWVLGNCTAPGQLAELVLGVFLQTAKDLVAQGLPLASALDRLASTGLDRVDAARILAKLAASGSSGRGLGTVTELLAEGSLGEARRTFDAVPKQDSDDETERIKTALEAAEQRKRALLDTYREALGRRDIDAAGRALNEAKAVDKADESLDQLLDRLPPPAPTGVSASPAPSGTGLSVSWRYAGPGETRFILVRSTGSTPPANVGDGSIVGTVDAMSAVDANPPAGVEIHYAVFAERRNQQSQPGSLTTRFLPAPSGFSASVSSTEATLTWRTPASATGVQLTCFNEDGSRRPVDAPAAGQVTVHGLATGARYRFTIEAIYVLPGGQRMTSPPATVDAVPRGELRWVSDLAIEQTALRDGRPGFRASWTETAGYPVQLWMTAIDGAPPAPGSALDIGDLESSEARRLAGVIGGAQGRATLDFPPVSGMWNLLPVTIDGDRGVVGAAHIVGSAPDMRNPHVDRFGDELVLSWDWPHGDYTARVEVGSGPAARYVDVTRAEYSRNGGVRIGAAAGVASIGISTVTYGRDRTWVSAAIRVDLPRVAPAITYDLDIPAARFGRRKPATVRVSSAAPAGLVQLVAVARCGRIMPNTTADGDVIADVAVDLSSGSAVASFEIPKLPSPFWIRLFSPSGAVVVTDPPTHKLKG